MAVRDALLSILLLGPGYGFQLHGELATRTGGRRVVNVGQTYATLERLSERGLVASAGATEDGLPLYGLTDAGRQAANAWLDGADAPVSDPWDETIERVLVAGSLPGMALTPVLQAERARWTARHVDAAARMSDAETSADDPAPRMDGTGTRDGGAATWSDAGSTRHDPDDASADSRASAGREPAARGASLIGHAAAVDAARAATMLAWLDRVASDPPEPFGLSTERPRRGRRPARRTEASAQSASA